MQARFQDLEHSTAQMKVRLADADAEFAKTLEQQQAEKQRLNRSCSDLQALVSQSLLAAAAELLLLLSDQKAATREAAAERVV